MLDIILYLLFLIPVVYWFVFAWAASLKRDEEYTPTSKLGKVLILIPVGRESKVDLKSVDSILWQKYPSELFKVVVIADQIKPTTLFQLKKMGVQVLEAFMSSSSKTKALKYAMNYFDEGLFDIVVVLNVTSSVTPYFVSEVNRVYQAGFKAMQISLISKESDLRPVLLDGVSKEIDQSILCRGHIRLGLSSGLLGTGMAFDFGWFRKNVYELLSVNGERELQLLLAEQSIPIAFVESVSVCEDRKQPPRQESLIRLEPLSERYHLIRRNLPQFISSLVARKWDLADALYQTLLPSRLIASGLILIIASLMTIVDSAAAIKWWGLLGLLIVSLIFSMPDRLFTSKFYSSLVMIPRLFISGAPELFRWKRKVKKIIIQTKRKRRKK